MNIYILTSFSNRNLELSTTPSDNVARLDCISELFKSARDEEFVFQSALVLHPGPTLVESERAWRSALQVKSTRILLDDSNVLIIGDSIELENSTEHKLSCVIHGLHCYWLKNYETTGNTYNIQYTEHIFSCVISFHLFVFSITNFVNR